MLTRMQQRRGLASEWSDSVISSTVILAAGEVGLETDTGRFKVGNGTTVWANLPYYLPDNNPTNSTSRIGKNNHDIYSKLSPLGPGYSQTFTGGNVMIPQSGSQTPLVVAGLVGQTALLQSWRSNISNTTPVASISNVGKLTAAGAEFNATVDMNTNKIVDLGTPTADADAATKLYVDQAIAGLSWKAPVNLVSASALDTYINVPLTGNTGTLVLDGHAALDSTDSGYRILLFAQTTASENGIYVYNDNGTTYTLTRSVDADTYAEINGASVFVNEGTSYGTSSWVQTNHYLSSFEDQEWIQFNGASQIVADGGLTKVGNTLAVGGTTDRIQINTNSVDISANYVGQTSITTLGTVTTGTWTADTIAADQGGTGQSSYTIGDILYASSTSALSKLPAGTLNYPLISGGTGTDPLYGQIVTDAIADSSSTTTGVTYSKIQYVSAANKILGRISSGSGHIEELNADNVISIVNGGTSEFSISRIPTGTTSSTVALGDHTHTIDQLSDVVITGTPAIRQVIKYNGSSWVNELPSGGISTGPTPPTEPSNGDAWFDTTDGSLYVRYDDGNGNVAALPSLSTVSVNSSLVSGYRTSLSYSATYDSGTNQHVITYTYSITTSNGAFITNLPITGYLNIDGNTVWSPSGTYTFPTNSTTVLASGTYSRTFVSNSLNTVTLEGLIDDAGSSFPPLLTLSSSSNLATGSPASSAQWVQVKANSALEASILTRMSAVEARDTKLEAANAVRVANQAERDATYPSPVQGNTVFRADLGYEEKYYAAYNATTNPDGTTGTIGWYRYAGGAPLSDNVVINGAVDYWQRGAGAFSGNTWNADRFYTFNYSGTSNTTQVTLPLADAATLGTDGAYMLRLTPGTAGDMGLITKIEDVRTFAGDTVTISFWAKTTSGTTNFQYVNLSQEFGTGGSTSVYSGVQMQSSSVTTSWKRFIGTVSLASISGKTIGTGSFLQFRIDLDETFTGAGIDFTGFQVELGPVATPFRRNQPNPQAELAACQRYWQQTYPIGTPAGTATNAGALMQYVPATGNTIRLPIQLGVRMRIAPTVNTYGAGTGAAGKWQYEGAGTTSQFDSGVTFGAEGGFLIYAAGATVAGSNVYIHYTANAEL